MAWPDQKVFDGLAEGDEVDRVTLASTVTGPSGSYAVSVNPATVPSEYISDDGWVDMEVWVADASVEAIWETTLANVGGTWVNAGDVPSIASGETVAPVTPSISVDLGSGRVADTAIDTDQMIDDAGEDIAPADAAAMITTSVADRSDSFDAEFRAQSTAGAPIPMACGAHLIDYTRGVTEYYQHLQGTGNLRAEARESFGTSHTIGVAADIGAVGGGWTQSGTRTLTFDDASEWVPYWPSTRLGIRSTTSISMTGATRIISTGPDRTTCIRCLPSMSNGTAGQVVPVN